MFSEDPYYLRRMKREDLLEVMEIELKSFSNPWTMAAFKGEIDNYPISQAYVIAGKNLSGIIGYITYWQIQKEVQISNFALHPDYRRQGIGESILRRVIDKVKEQGAVFVFLEVRPSNFSANSLYAKLGFKTLGTRKNYYHDPDEDALIMGKML
jgi:ribosomal-protein-alanine N-acetyltransferase